MVFMKISGFTIVRNALKYNYPVLESIRSILPLVDEFIVNVGKSEDGTLELIRSIQDPKIRIIETAWDMSQGHTVLSEQTNRALSECTGDWAFYLQSDEVIHEDDLPKLKCLMERHLEDPAVEAIRFRWFHFYGSYFRYRVDSGWYQKQDRIIRNNGQIHSIGDAYGFERKDRQPLKRLVTRCFVYHYGWVHPADMMTTRRVNAENIGFTSLENSERKDDYRYGDMGRFPIYFGTHPAVMKERIRVDEGSQSDYDRIRRQYWWSPLRLFKIRYKTVKRVRERIA